MLVKYRFLAAVLLVGIIGAGLNSSAQPLNQPLMFLNLTDNPHSGGQLLPALFNGQPAMDGWVVQIICDGAGDGIDPPIPSGPDAGMPSDDDFLADSVQNLVSYWRMNGRSVMGDSYAGIFLPFQYLLCLAEGTGTEPVINVGDRIYLRAFNSDHWSSATLYLDMTETRLAAYSGGYPVNIYGAEFSTVAVNPKAGPVVITEWKLHQNYPNPFNPVTTITYDVLNKGRVFLTIYNISGQEAARLVDGRTMSNGRYLASFDASVLSSGIYFYQIKVEAESGESFKSVRKLALVK